MRLPRALSLALGLVALSTACGTLIGIKDLTDGTGEGAADGASESGSGSETGAADGANDDAPVTSDSAVSDVDAGADAVADADCGDTGTDKDNCGRCGHSCLGGDCSAGKCQPFPLAPGQGQISDVVLDATYVYFSSISGDVVGRVPKAGGVVKTLASAPNVHVAKRVRVNATHVFWANDDFGPGTVSRCPLAGCTGAPTVLANPEDPTGLALDSDYVTWADSNAFEIRRRPLDGGAAKLVVTPSARPLAVATDPPFTFWIEDFTGAVYRTEPADGGSVLIGVSGTSGRVIATDKSYVYWGSAQDPGDPGHIARAPRAGGPTDLLGEAHGEPRGLFVDDQRVYWAAWETASDGGVVGGGVYSCDRAGCAIERVDVAVGIDHPSGVAVDNEAIYFGTKTGVMKVAR